MFLLLLLSLEVYSITVPALFSNSTIVRNTMTYQYGYNGTQYSYYQPELICNSCYGNSTCNNTSPICQKRLLNLTYTQSSVKNQTLAADVYTVNQPQIVVSYPVTNVFYCNGRCEFKLSKRQTSIVSLSYRTLLVQNDALYATSVQWVINEFNGFATCPVSDCQLTLPSEIFVKDGLLTVRVYVGETLSKVVTFPIDATQVCDIKECDFICYEYLTNFLCYSKTTQIIVGFSFAVSVLCLTALMMFTMWKVYCCVKNKYTIQMPVGTQVIACILLVCVISADANCISTTTVAVPISQCSVTSGQYKCTTSLNSIINLPYVGAQACFVFTNDKGKVIGEANFTYVNSVLTAPLTTKYFTSDWIPRQWSDKSCRQTSDCPSDGCLNPEPIMNTHFPETLVIRGFSTCEASCGCAGCGCFFCSDACLYSRYGFQPTTVYEVKTIGAMTILPRIEVNYNFNNTPQSTVLELQQNFATPDFSMTLLGSFISTTYDMGSKSVIFSLDGLNSAYMQETAPIGSPQFGMIGDLQSTTFSGFASNPPTFIFPATPVPHTSSQSSTSYIFPVPGIQLNQGLLALPRVDNGVMWTVNANYLYGLNPTPPAVALTMSSQYTNFSLTSNTVCPAIGTYRITGCFSCMIGFSLSVNLYSTCNAGGVSVSVESPNFICVTNFLSISTSPQNYILNCVSNSPAPFGTITFKGDTTTSISVSGVLVQLPELNETLVKQIFQGTPIQFDGIGSFWDAFQGNAAIIKWTVLAVFIAVAAIAAAGFSMSVYNWFKVKRTHDEMHVFLQNFEDGYENL